MLVNMNERGSSKIEMLITFERIKQFTYLFFLKRIEFCELQFCDSILFVKTTQDQDILEKPKNSIFSKNVENGP